MLPDLTRLARPTGMLAPNAPAIVVPPPPLIVTEPLIYLSAAQESVLKNRFPGLALRYPNLPAWVPQRLIAQALGHSQKGIRKARASLDGMPYLWATEFENVHDLWKYDEPELTIDGETYKDSETYYQMQKPEDGPGVWEAWQLVKDDVMRKGIRAKFALDPTLRELLRVTGEHPLLAIKPDEYWGFDAKNGGRNRLAELWMELRHEMLYGS